MKTSKFICFVISSLFSIPALAGGVTGGTGMKTNISTFRQVLLDKANFKVVEVQSLRGYPVNIEGESHVVESMDLENRAIVLTPESGQSEPLVVTESEAPSE